MMIFACWAWRDSYFLNRFAERGGYGFSHMNGGIALARSPHYRISTSGSAPPGTVWRLETFPPPLFILGAKKALTPGTGQDKTELVEPFTVKECWTYAAPREPGSLRIFIPYWLILSGTASLWLALLFWRARRRAPLHAPG